LPIPLQERDPIVLCLIDGDGNIFDDALLRQGREGGSEAAKILNENILVHCNESLKQRKQINLWTYIFVNMRGLQITLARSGVCTAAEFEAFVTGFNQANSRFTICDVHYGKEAADAKIKSKFKMYSIHFSNAFQPIYRLGFGLTKP